MARVAVTGAAGFVGRALVETLVARGHDVVAFSRTGRPGQAGAPSPLVAGPFGSGFDWVSALRGIDTVVHAAGRAHRGGDGANDLALFRQGNVAPTLEVSVAAARAGVKRFVYLSSVKVHGENSARGRNGVWREDDPIHPEDVYALSKAEAELALEQAHTVNPAMAIVLLRLPLVYGPGVGANFRTLLSIADTPWPLPFGALRNRRSLLYVGNLADAVARIVEVDRPLQGVFFATDGEAETLATIVARLRRALGRRRRLFPVPPPVLALAFALLGRHGWRTRLLGALAVDGTRLPAVLGGPPPVGPDEAFAATAAWYRRNRDAPSP